ncbi:MAG: DUF1569 domain-containing protein [Acidobacteriota bacterium]
MPTLFDPSARGELVSRLSRLTPDRRPLWGRMDASLMQVHLIGSLRLATGELVCKPKKTILGYPGVRELLIHVLPWPKGAPTAPELLVASSAEFEADRKTLRELVEQVGTRKPEEPFAAHPAFGRLSRRTWGVLGWRHIDHHLRQFGL